MRGQVIGKTMPHGYAGSYARQPDMVVDTAPLGGTDIIAFGAPVIMGANGAVQAWTGEATAKTFWGVAVREVKSAVDYMDQNKSGYRPGEAVPVMKRGCVNVICQSGTPAAGGAVYVRTKTNSAKPTAVIGGFEATADGDNSVVLSNAQWKGQADGNGVAELRILTINNA